MQNAGIATLNLNWRYLAFDVHPDNLALSLDGAKAMKFIGLNLTVPHKLLALDLMDALDDSAKAWGAVNTVRFEARNKDGEWTPLSQLSPWEISEVRAKGFNTDADAITKSLAEDLEISLKESSVMLLGAGGAGRAAALKIASENVKRLYLLNRTIEKAMSVAIEIAQRFPATPVSVIVPNAQAATNLLAELARNKTSITVHEGYPAEPLDLVINATSLGLKVSDPLPVDSNWLQAHKPRCVYDMIYRPAETPLLQAAKALGCRTANGMGMLLYQGAKALELWTGKPAPVEVMRKALERHIYG